MRAARVQSLRYLRWCSVVGGIFLGLEGRALAWSPAARTTLSDLARTRLDALSFFAVGWLLCCEGFRALWNVIAIGRPTWSPLTYRRTLGWSLLLSLVVLGAIMLLTAAWEAASPGSWSRSSAARRLAAAFALDPSEFPPPLEDHGADDDKRRRRLETLREHLWADASSRNGAFPVSREDSSVPSDLWSQPGFSSVSYIYRPGLRLDGPPAALVMEYDLSDDGQWVLMSDGAIRRLLSAAESDTSATTESRK